MQLTSNIINSMLIAMCLYNTILTLCNVFSYTWVRSILQSFLGGILLAHDYVIDIIPTTITVTLIKT